MDFPLYFQILRGRVQGVFFKLGSYFFCQTACIDLLKSCGGPQCFDFDITYFYPIIVTPYPKERNPKEKLLTF